MSFLRLYLEELKAIPRGRFALAGAALILAFLAFLAAVVGPSQGSGHWGFLLFAHAIIPGAFAAFAAVQVAEPRSSKFVHAIFTTPVSRARFFAASVLAALTVGLLYVLGTLPFVGVFIAHLGFDPLFWQFLFVALGVVLFSTALGTFLGVALAGRGLAAPVGIAIAVMTVSVFAVPFLIQSVRADPAGVPPGLLRLVHLSPHVLLFEITGLLSREGIEVGNLALPAAALAASIVGLLACAAWIYLRHQGVETWEGPARRRAGVALAIAALVLMPPALATTEYETVDLSSRGPPPGLNPQGAWASVVPNGTPASAANFGFPLADVWERPLPIGKTTSRDLLILLPLDPGTPLRDVTINLRGERGLEISSPTRVTFETLTPVESGRRPTTSMPGPMGENSGPKAVALRVPVDLEPTEVHSLTRSLSSVRVEVTYTVEGDAAPRKGATDVPLLGRVPGAPTQLALAGLPLLLAATGGAVLRRLRTH